VVRGGSGAVDDGLTVRQATPADAEAVGRLLDAFNREFGAPTPGAAEMAERVRELLAAGEMTVLLVDGGVAVLRFRPSLWSRALECTLAELYVEPERRGHGRGRALLDAAIELARSRGADYMELATSEDDVAARGLYESAGFSNRDDGSLLLFYERDL
jgi:ribosomal protein S18 acetylase RimI-like enzyme